MWNGVCVCVWVKMWNGVCVCVCVCVDEDVEWCVSVHVCVGEDVECCVSVMCVCCQANELSQLVGKAFKTAYARDSFKRESKSQNSGFQPWTVTEAPPTQPHPQPHPLHTSNTEPLPPSYDR